MEGRWTIRWLPLTASGPGGYKVGGTEPWPGETPTPVVPCDDAAVERVAQALLDRRRKAVGLDLVPVDRMVEAESFRRDAEAALRAAGETP